MLVYPNLGWEEKKHDCSSQLYNLPDYSFNLMTLGLVSTEIVAMLMIHHCAVGLISIYLNLFIRLIKLNCHHYSSKVC